MSEELQLMLNNDGVFEKYDDTYDLTIHCESKEEQEEVLSRLSRRWVPTSERMPENPGRYLTYIINKNDEKLQYIMTCEYIVSDLWNWFPDDDCASDNVIAWMPLPEPYKAESEDE